MEQEIFPGQWTEDQWSLVQQTVRDEARKVSVAGSFLPRNGPWPSETDSVPTQELDDVQPFPGGLAPPGAAPFRLAVDDRTTRPLSTISVNVFLRSTQAAQPDLSSALSMFRRAANIIARVEDAMVFNGQRARVDPRHFAPLPQVYTVSGGGVQWQGLFETAELLSRNQLIPGSRRDIDPEDTVQWVEEAISQLESDGHLGPYALVVGTDLFGLIHTPTPVLVMPADRIKPQLNGGPLLRSSTLQRLEGVIVSLGGDPVELVLASDISVKFLQVTMEPRHVYRVSQRFTLRIKQQGAIWGFSPGL